MTIPRFKQGRVAVTGEPMRQHVTGTTIPAPVGGINTMESLHDMTPKDCIFTYNLMPSELGMRTRLGNDEWANTFTGGNIRTILPYVGKREDHFDDRLFALNDEGIYDISSQGVAGTTKFDWATQSGDAGWGIYTHFTNDAGAHFLMLADEQNGLHEYEEATDTWTLSTGITGPTIANIAHVTAFKKRLWFVENDSSSAWYLPAGAKAGAAIEFNFGAQFREGGPLIGLWSWTVDGGDGVDDYLVAISRAGGVAVYQGTDPANASTFGLVGVWYIGSVPAGHRIASEYGGQLFIMSEHGLININRLIQGASVQDVSNLSTDKITRALRARMVGNLDTRGWEIRVIHSENAYVIVAPSQSANDTPTQFVRNLTTNGWGIWRGMDVLTGDIWQSSFYWADSSGSVWKHAGFLDFSLLDGTPGIALEFSMLTSYQDYGAAAIFKRTQNLRPHFLSDGIPSFSVQARYDYDLAEGNEAVIFNPVDAALWDAGKWDEALWAGGIEATQSLRGASGIGLTTAVALRGQTSFRLTLVAIDILADAGGYL